MARPGRRNFTISPAGSGLSPFQDKAATIYTIANTGAMLIFGQERATLNAALAVESRCDPIVPVATNANSSRVSGPYNRRAGAAPADIELGLGGSGGRQCANRLQDLFLLRREPLLDLVTHLFGHPLDFPGFDR